MSIQCFPAFSLPEGLRAEYEKLLQAAGLRDEYDADVTVLSFDDDGHLLACGSLHATVLKQIAVSADAEGLGLAGEIVTELVTEAAHRGQTHLFLFTSPDHATVFSSLGFFPVISTGEMLMMENRRDGLERYLSSLPKLSGRVGCVVCNCDPFTLGHRYLVETAASMCDNVYVFVVSEDLSLFSAEDRYKLVCAGTADLKNVTVVRADAYLISRATFPTYFIKEKEQCSHAACELDVALFAGRIAPYLGISVRFVGEEPFDPITADYNRCLAAVLPAHGIRLEIIQRFCGISAREVRKMIKEGRLREAKELLPETTYEYCVRHFGAGAGIPG